MQPTTPIPPFELERYFAHYEFDVPYLLCVSDVQGYAMRDLLALADDESRALWDNLALGYTESAGHPLLRAEIAKLYATAASEDVLVCTSGEEAIYALSRVILRAGDHAIVTFPGYQSSYQLPESIGASVSRWQLRPREGQWRLDLDELRKLIRPNTRLIAVNLPHNPTGALPTHDEWREIVSLAREANCYLIADEVYRGMEFDPRDQITAAVDAYAKGVSIGAMSKTYALAGLRIGWVATHDRALLAQVQAYRDYTTICSSAPSEILALIALRAKDKVVARSMSLLRRNLDQVNAFMRARTHLFEWIPPRAGSVAFAKWLGAQPIAQLADDLVRAEGVLLLPSSVFDIQENYFRVGLGRENLPDALAHFGRFLER